MLFLVLDLGIVVFGMAALVSIRRSKNRYRTRATIIPEYEPYVDLDTKEPVGPIYTGLLLDLDLDERAVTAGIVYLAAEGYLSIKQTERRVAGVVAMDDHEVTLVRLLPDDTDPILKKVLLMLSFDNKQVGESVLLSTLSKTAGEREATTAMRLEVSSLGEIYLREHGYTESLRQVLLRTREVTAGLFVVTVAALFLVFFEHVLTAALLLVFAILFTYVALSDRLTPKGYEARRYLQGFKQFLTVTGRDRFTFRDDPAVDPSLFIEYLPYAVALGVEKNWANVFAERTVATPQWYVSADPTSFNPVGIAESLAAFPLQLFGTGRDTGASSVPITGQKIGS